MSKLICRSLPLRTTSRAFSTSTARAISLQLERNDPEKVADVVPAYPYGPAQWYKQSDKGLYGGQRLRFGNNVGEKFQTKSRRLFKVNVTNKRLWSTALGRWVQVRVTTRVLRTIDKVGGLDEYLLGEKEARIKDLGMSGWWLRWAIMRTPSVRERYSREREELGLESLRDELDKLAAVEVDGLSNVAGLERLPTAILDGIPEVIKPGDELLQGVTQSEFIQDEDADVAEIEVLTTDDAFQVENPPHLPKLEFRVNNNRRLVMTSTGWKIYRGDKKESARKAKAKISKTFLPHVVSHMAIVEENLPKTVELVEEDVQRLLPEKSKSLMKVPITEREKAVALVRSKHHFRARWRDAVQGVYSLKKWERTKKGKKELHRRWRVARDRSRAAEEKALGGEGFEALSSAISEQPITSEMADVVRNE